MPPTLRRGCPLSCGNLRTPIRAHLRALPGIEQRLMPRIFFPHCGLIAISDEWLIQRADALVCINMIHITPWAASKGLMTGAERVLPPGGVLYLYGPYRIDDRHTAQSNEDFDAWLRTQNAQWGVRDVAEVAGLAQRHAFSLTETVSMPANNLSVVFERRP